MARPKKDAEAGYMYDLYLEGYSLEQVGRLWGITRQSVYGAFARRGWLLRSRKVLPTITHHGKTYSLDPYGYLRQTNGERRWLHQVVWEEHHGSMPPGYEIHHKDGDKTNNSIENLDCLTPQEHAAIHQAYHNLPAKQCAWCCVPLVRKRQPSGRLETPAEVVRRTYCGRVCQTAHKRGKPKGWSPQREETEST